MTNGATQFKSSVQLEQKQHKNMEQHNAVSWKLLFI